MATMQQTETLATLAQRLRGELITPADAANRADVDPERFRIGMLGTRPVYRFLAGNSWTTVFADTGEPLASCKGHSAGIYAVAFSPDSAHLATGGFDGQVRLYRTQDCTLEKSFVPVPLISHPTAQTPRGGPGGGAQ